jgi:hypothetical protein
LRPKSNPIQISTPSPNRNSRAESNQWYTCANLTRRRCSAIFGDQFIGDGLAGIALLHPDDQTLEVGSAMRGRMTADVDDERLARDSTGAEEIGKLLPPDGAAEELNRLASTAATSFMSTWAHRASARSCHIPGSTNRRAKKDHTPLPKTPFLHGIIGGKP